MKTGIDISTHNGWIDWSDMEYKIDFAIIRAGYSLTIDEKADNNFKGCNRLGIPAGAYWFSYATSVEQAKREAVCCCDFLKKYKITMPVAYDFEYDSIEYVRKKGVTITASLMCEMADAFLSVVKANGYEPMLYTNVDFMNKGFNRIANKYKLWLAHWGVQKPSYDCFLWQFTDSLSLSGLSGRYDGNKLMKESENAPTSSELSPELRDNFLKSFAEEYFNVAVEILNGKWGNGTERKEKLNAAGYDYQAAQAMVNEMLK